MDEVAPGAMVRGLIRSADRAALATTAGDGGPYAGLVLIACDHAGAPLLLISDLAEHTRNLRADPRACLLIDGTMGLDDPLTGARASVRGLLTPLTGEGLDPARDRYVRRHPSAAGYVGFGDFHLFRMTVERAHLVAGFGKISWAPAEDVLLDLSGSAPLAAAEAEIVAHMNEDHADAVAAIGAAAAGQAPWRMVGVDPEGCDLRADGRVARIVFAKRADDAQDARVELVRLTKRARSGVEH